MFNMNNKQREIVAILLFLALIAMACLFGSCNVTRTITTTAQTVQKGDTTTVITTRTVETVDGTVDASKFIKAK